LSTEEIESKLSRQLNHFRFDYVSGKSKNKKTSKREKI
jgi:hypothetical protein